MFRSLLVILPGILVVVLCLDEYMTPWQVEKFHTDYELWLESKTPQEFRKMHAERMYNAMDRRYNPCQDFYMFSCGNFGKDFPEELLVRTQLDYIEAQKARVLERLLTSPISHRSPEYEIKARQYYQSCKSGLKSPQQIVDFVRSFGSRPALDSSWSESSYDWWNMTGLIKQYGVNIFFETGVGRVEEDTRFIRMYLKGPFYPDYLKHVNEEDTENSFRQIFSNVLRPFRIDPVYLSEMSERVYDFEDELLAIESEGEPSLVSVQELIEQVPDLDLVAFIKQLREDSVDLSEKILVSDVSYFQKLVHLIKRTDLRTIADFTFFRLVAHYRVFGPAFDRSNSEKQRTVECVHRVEEDMTPALSAVFVRKYYDADTYYQVNNLVEELFQITRILLNETRWTDEQTRVMAINKIENVRKVIGHKAYIDSDLDVSSLYANIEFDLNNFLKNKALLSRLKVKTDQALAGKELHELDPSPLDTSVGKTKGELRIMAGLTQPPIFHKFAPNFFKYGAFGFLVSNEIIKNLDSFDMQYDHESARYEWMSQYLTPVYNSRVKCFRDQVAVPQYPYLNIPRNTEEGLSDTDALKVAFRAYKSWSLYNKDQSDWEADEYIKIQLASEQIFFVSAAQMLCEARLVAPEEQSSYKLRFLRAITNSYEFAETFHCPKSVEMNPRDKCKYIID